MQVLRDRLRDIGHLVDGLRRGCQALRLREEMRDTIARQRRPWALRMAMQVVGHRIAFGVGNLGGALLRRSNTGKDAVTSVGSIHQASCQ